MKLTDRQCYVLAFLLLFVVWSVVIYLYLSAPALTPENCDLRVVAGMFPVCR